MRLIDADKLLNDLYMQEDRFPESHLIRTAINEAPTVDAAPVVRCGECAHSVDMTDVENQCATCHWKKCKLTGKQVLENGFCNNGERKDGEK